MKKLSISVAAFCGAMLLHSCGVNQALVMNHNQNATQVQLSGNNFKVLDKVKGTADVPYILGIGGINRKHVFEQAYSSMMDNANLKNSSRAVINVVTEEHMGGVPPFYVLRTVTVSGNVIEFTR
jgi:hypothetical protein